MYILYEVKFDNSLPSEETILKSLETNSGLGTIMTQRMDYGDLQICNPNDPADGCEFYIQDKSVFVEGYTLEYTYLTASLLRSLMKLGGAHSGWVPDWASLSWEEAKPFLSYPPPS